ncbi:MAG: hypothetical protein MST12_04315 [Spirochaetia bacterium]|nr:hypothetical protein [Spirochaetia bacterium]
MKKIVNRLFSVVLSASIFALASCEIGLGESVDIKGPVVTITSPSPRENVQGIFSVRGTAKDDTAVESLTVTCDNYTWKHTSAGWVVDDGSGSGFVPYADSTWIENPATKNVSWEVNNIDFSSKNAGDYEIIAFAFDTSGNTSGDSRKTRTVVVDKTAPDVKVSSPLTKNDGTYFESISEYTDITVVSNFVTGDFTIAGSTTDENTIKYIDVYVKSTDDTQTYFECRLAQDVNNIPGDYTPTQYKIIDSLRAWEVEVKLEDCSLKTLDGNKHVLKIVTKAEDTSGNSGTKSHGNFCLWKNAAKPWIEVNLGTSYSPLSVYAGSKILGNAYDDTAVSKVYATVKTNSGAIVGDYNKKEIYSGTDENNVFFNLEVPQDCEKYYLAFETEDIHGNKSDEKSGYIKVEDKTFPYVEIKHKVGNLEKSNSETLFGDEKGDFTFVLNATDDTNVTSLKVAYMTSDIAIVNYSNKDYAGWTTVGTQTSDLKSGKVLEINLEENGTDPSTQRKKYKAELPVNIFTDLGIDGSEGKRLSNQTFVFRVQDGNGNAITKDYTILGDIEAPSIEFTNIVYGSETFTQNKDGKPVSGGETFNNGIPAFTSDSSITVNGRISDDAINAWGLVTVKEKWNSSKNGELFKLECNGIEIEPTIDTSNPVTGNGKKWFKFSATVANTAAGTSLKGSSLVYKALLKDYNNNQMTQTYAFLVDTQTLKVEYIYTSLADGCYGDTDANGDVVIPIKIRFNKSLKFTPGASMPQIRLNNDTEADKKYYSMSSVSDSGDREFVFNYTVKDGGTDIDRLNVKEFKLNGGKISDSNSDVTSAAVALIQSAVGNGSSINLANKKNITIIKTLPAITNIAVTPDNDYTKTTVEITYSKAVKKGSGDITITQKNVTKVPPVLSETEYKILASKKPAIADYYEYTTNGATSEFVADLTPKYVLKFEYDAGDPTLVELYKNTNNHIIAQNVKSNKVTLNSATGNKTVTVVLDKLPCIGAEYDISIPEGFVVDKAGGSSFPAAKYDSTVEGYNSYLFSTTALPLEKPVIRIKKDDTKVTKATDDGFESTQPMTASVKIDCETPGIELNYFYTLSSVVQRVYNFVENSGTGTGLATKPTATTTTGIPASGDNSDSSLFNIGDDTRNGLTYKITATATKEGKSTKGYEVAQRTTIQINNDKGKLALRSNSMLNKTFTNWPGETMTESNLTSKRLGLFLRGGDNPTGGNTTPGLATSWSPSDLDKAILFTEDTTSGKENFYIVSWKITKNLYFMPLAGLMDDETIMNGKYQGPKYTCNAQNRWIGTYTSYPAEPGSYLVVKNDQDFNVSFEVGDPGKAKVVR